MCFARGFPQLQWIVFNHDRASMMSELYILSIPTLHYLYLCVSHCRVDLPRPAACPRSSRHGPLLLIWGMRNLRVVVWTIGLIPPLLVGLSENFLFQIHCLISIIPFQWLFWGLIFVGETPSSVGSTPKYHINISCLWNSYTPWNIPMISWYPTKSAYLQENPMESTAYRP